MRIKNPVFRLVWGIEPPSARRLLLAASRAVWPLLVYLICLDLQWRLYTRNATFLHRLSPQSPEMGWGVVHVFLQLELATRWIGVLFIVALAGWRASLPSAFSRNWPQLRLAGITPRQLLWGRGSPFFLGAAIVAGAHFAATFLNMAASERVGASMIRFNQVVQVLAIEFTLLGSAWLVIAMPPRRTPRVRRLALVAGFALCSPIIPYLATSAASNLGLRHPDVTMPLFVAVGNLRDVLVLAEVLSWPLRFAWLLKFWRRSLEILNLEDDTVAPSLSE